MEFSEEQQKILEKCKEGKNIFITGPGGSGKSAIIREIYSRVNQQSYSNMYSTPKIIQVCALTGCAAVLLNCRAKTIHSWGGIGQGTGSIEWNIEKITSNKFKKKNWLKTDILIIDEVSMMSKKLFDMLNAIGKRVRKNSLPFGGIQVIFSGDFFQLPPVGDVADDPDTCKYCFESEDWNTVFAPEDQVQLVKIYRQSEDDVYASILNQLREGRLKRSSYDILKQQIGKPVPENCLIKPTKLFPRRHNVDIINQAEMSKLVDAIEFVYELKYEIDAEPPSTSTKSKYNVPTPNSKSSTTKTTTIEEIQYEHAYLERNTPCEKKIKLKIGAQVMCIVNLPDLGLCNGSQGVIVRFNEIGLPVVKFLNISTEIVVTPHKWVSENIPNIGISQIPLILAWALTIHKAQGATMELAEIDVGNNVFECGQTYVALSRVKSIKGLYLTAFCYDKILTNKKVKEFYLRLDASSSR